MPSEELLDVLVRNRLFQDMDRELLRQFDDAFFLRKNYSQGQLVIQEGEQAEDLYLIVSGCFKAVSTLLNGEELELNAMGDGDVFGELALLENQKRSVSVVCAKEGELLAIRKDDFFHIFHSLPQLSGNISKIISSRLRRADTKIVSDAERYKELLECNCRISLQKQELEAQKEQLQILNATKDKFFSIISHDLRNPISAMIGISLLLMDMLGNSREEELKKMVDVLKNSAENAHKLLENLLLWAQMQMGRIGTMPEEVDLSQIASEACAPLLSKAFAKHIDLSCTIPEKTDVYADRNMAAAVLRNLVSNALKFTPDRGHVTIGAQDRGTRIEVHVADSGIGMAPQSLAKLFRLDTHYTTPGLSKERGTGLGLLLCKEFVEKNGGRIWAESELGQGSTFRFTIPKAPPVS